MKRSTMLGACARALPGLFVAAIAACEAGTTARVVVPADSAAGEVAFELTGPNEAALVVPVSINGRPAVNFVLDTGATLTCVDVSLARELKLPEASTVGGVAIGALAAGRIQAVKVDSIRVGNAVAYDLLACRLDLGQLRTAFGAHGLLGLNFLKSFDVALDFERNIVRLQ